MPRALERKDTAEQRAVYQAYRGRSTLHNGKEPVDTAATSQHNEERMNSLEAAAARFSAASTSGAGSSSAPDALDAAAPRATSTQLGARRLPRPIQRAPPQRAPPRPTDEDSSRGSSTQRDTERIVVQV